MKLKFYTRMFLATMTIMLVVAGCKKDETKTPTPDPVSFELQITRVESGRAVVSVKPSDKTVTYFFGAMVKTELDAFASEAALLAAEAKRVEALAQGDDMTTEAYLKANGKHGDNDVVVESAVPLTAYYAYVYAIDAAGKVTSKVFKVEFTSGEAPATAPKLELNMTPGDAQGLDKDIRMTVSGKSSGVISGRMLLAVKSELDFLLAHGTTLESIINDTTNENITPFEPEELGALNSEAGWSYSFRKLTPGIAYTFVAKVTNEIGSTIESISASTLVDAGGEAPALEVSLTRGDKDGKNKSTNMMALIKSTGAMAGRYGLFAKSQVDAALEKGYTLSYLIENNGFAFSQEQLDLVNSGEGYNLNAQDLEPNSSHTFIAKVASTGGTTVKMASATTTTGIGPTVNVAMVPGDKEGLNTDVNMFIVMKSSNVLLGRQALLPKAEFDKEIEKGTTPAELLDTYGESLTSSDLAGLNSAAGMERVFGSLLPETAYMHIMEAEDDNGTSLEFTSALTTASGGSSSDLTFTFEIEDLAPTAAILTVIPSNNTETYYFDYQPATQYDTKTDVQWIANLIGDKGISVDNLSTGIAGYDASWFEMMALDAGTEYYIYAFGYDAETKSATTGMVKQKFTTPTGKETPTDAYNAWLGTWTVTSTSSEKSKEVVSFDITITQKVVNISYKITGWSATTSYATRSFTAALKEDGGIRVRNNQEIGNVSGGILTYAGRFFNSNTSKYARVPSRIDGLTGNLSGGQAATIVGSTFTLDGDPNEYTVSTMDYFNHKAGDTWTGYTANGAFTTSGHPVGPYTLIKSSNSAVMAFAEAPHAKMPQTAGHKMGLAKRALTNEKIVSMSSVMNGGKKSAAVPTMAKMRSVATLNLSCTTDRIPTSETEKFVLRR